MKIFMISLAFLAGLSLASAFTPEQNTTLEGMGLAFQLGMAYQEAKEGQNVTGFNALVDQYNAWMMIHFGNETTLLMQKMDNASANLESPYAIGKQVTEDTMVYASDASGNIEGMSADSVIANDNELDQAPNMLLPAQIAEA